MYFEQLLTHVPDGVKYVISVICGNDIYGASFDTSLKLAIGDYVAAVDVKAPMHYAVVGMSAETWQYDACHACAYDVDACKMRDSFQSQLVPTCSGVSELRGLKLSDAIGHVHPDSERIVFNAYKAWLGKCVELEARPPPAEPLPPPAEPLPPPAPALPVPPVLEAPWVATWQANEACYGFFLEALGFAQWELPEASRDGWFHGNFRGEFCWRKLDSGATSQCPPPLVQAPWRVHWSEGKATFFFANENGGDITLHCPPVVPDGWEARWCDDEDVFYYVHVGTGRWFWELDVPVLQASRLLSNEQLRVADVKRGFKRAAVRLHPDKGGDSAVWTDTQARFEIVLAMFASMADTCSSAWVPCWCEVQRCFAWAHLVTGKVAVYEEDVVEKYDASESEFGERVWTTILWMQALLAMRRVRQCCLWRTLLVRERLGSRTRRAQRS